MNKILTSFVYILVLKVTDRGGSFINTVIKCFFSKTSKKRICLLMMVFFEFYLTSLVGHTVVGEIPVMASEVLELSEETRKIEQTKKEVEENKPKISPRDENHSKNKCSKTAKSKKEIKTPKNTSKERQLKSKKEGPKQKEILSTESSGDNIAILGGKKYKYVKKLKGVATAYTSNKGSLTSTGKKPCVGIAAVDPRDISYGSRVIAVFQNGEIVECIANDTGSALRNKKCNLDIYLGSKKECIKFGRRSAEIYVLQKQL